MTDEWPICHECRGSGHTSQFTRDGYTTCDWCGGSGDEPRSIVVPELEHTVSDRGFIHMAWIDMGEDRRLKVYESSSAEEAKIWLSVVDDDGTAYAHMTLDQAQQLADQLVWLSEHHREQQVASR